MNKAVLAEWVKFTKFTSKFWLGIKYDRRKRNWVYNSDKKEFSTPSWIENKSLKSEIDNSETYKCAEQTQYGKFGKANLFQSRCSDKTYTVCEIAGTSDRPDRPIIFPNK